MAWWVFQNLVLTAALAAIVLLLCRAGRLGPVVRHALWVLVLVKFVTPPIVVWPWAAPDPLGVAQLDARVEEHRAAEAVLIHPVPEDIPRPFVPITELQQSRHAHVLASESSASIWPWLLAVWIAGSLFVVALESVRLWRLGSRIRHARPVDPAIARRVSALAARFDMTPLPARAIDDLVSPVVWCVGRPRLLWPSDLPADASDACLDGLIVHELAHIKRRDHFIGWIELAAAIVWWWNPVFWYVRAARREQAELACDAWVISALPNGRRAYAESLLTLSMAGGRGASPAAVLGVRASTRRVLERRLVMIMKGRVPVRLSWVGFSIVAVMAAATLPAWATGSQATAAAAPATTGSAAQATTVEVPAVVFDQAARTATRANAVVTTQVKPKPEPKEVVVKPVIVAPQVRRDYVLTLKRRPDLPADGEELLKAFDADQDALHKELEQKIAARKEALGKQLQALQDRYTKEGKLDEAVAIRDYIRAGMPGLESPLVRWIKR
jgi:beta-lactamase regulating signal transducer with metallopeptidase domain